VTTSSAQRIEGTDFELRAITEDDWELAKCVRLAALADTPDAFEATLAEELQLPESAWRARARDNAAGLTSRCFLAQREAVPCGMAVGVLNESTRRVTLNAMWVAGNVRRRGLGRALVRAVCDWARQRGAVGVDLEVTHSSRSARALYAALGFTPVTDVQETTCGARKSPAERMQLTWG
jgi:ribosomal protein S18 acetylase RimI-like enzyme